MTSDRRSPSPKTVCVPVCHSGHARQPAAASRSASSVRLEGTYSAAVPPCVREATSRVSPVSEGSKRPRYDVRRGALAEWLGMGLQNPVHQFDSGRRLFSVTGLVRLMLPMAALVVAVALCDPAAWSSRARSALAHERAVRCT